MAARLLMPMLLLLAVMPPAAAQVVVTGSLETAIEPVDVDSAFFAFGGQDTWFLTTGWHANPEQTIQFAFPPFAGFPDTIRLAARFSGTPVTKEIDGPSRQTWYRFDAPHDQTRVMFESPSAVGEGSRGPAFPYLTVSPSLVRDAAVIRSSGGGLLELADAAGNTVRTLPAAAVVLWPGEDDSGRRLPEGVYFCRLVRGEQSLVRKVILAR
jgi:hypothetical protein